MEINQKALDASKKMFVNMTHELNHLYGQIASGNCNGCAKCCREAVSAFYVEFLNIHSYLVEKNLLRSYMDKIESHYMHELIRKDDCPFLKEDKSCAIYPVRPLVCRLFGHSSRQAHEANYQNVFEMNQSADAYFYETYGVHLPEEVLNQKIDYCEAFEVDPPVTEDEKNEMVDQLFMLDSQFLMADLIPEDAINLSITNWFIYLKYDEETASEKRISHLLKAQK